jgi:hypothetical protein
VYSEVQAWKQAWLKESKIDFWVTHGIAYMSFCLMHVWMIAGELCASVRHDWKKATIAFSALNAPDSYALLRVWKVTKGAHTPEWDRDTKICSKYFTTDVEVSWLTCLTFFALSFETEGDETVLTIRTASWYIQQNPSSMYYFSFLWLLFYSGSFDYDCFVGFEI